MMMKTFTQALCLSLLGFGLASPAPLVGEVTQTTPNVERGIGANKCDFSRGSSDDWYTIELAGWGRNDFSSKSGCGRGVLDNLRGQCGSNILDWECHDIGGDPHDTRITFQLQSWMRTKAPGCVENAVHRASEGRNVNVHCNCHPRTGNC